MRNKTKYLVLFIALWFYVSQLVGQTTYSKEVEEQIKQVENNLVGRVKINGKTDNIEKRMASLKIKGLSIAVVSNYKVVWAKGYGWADEKEKRPVTTATLFEPGSISKSLNAVGVLKLAQDKKLDLNTDINSYLKSWKFPYDSLSKNKKITLTNLLSHSAGLSVHGFQGYSRKAKIPTVPEILDGKKPANSPAVRSEFEPGIRSQYSGGGVIISQLIIMDVTQQPYDKFMYDNVLKPMGMVNSFFTQPPPENKLKLAATGYYSDGSEVENKFHVYPEQAAAGLWMTPSDLCNYIIETQLAYEGKSSKVLTPEMTRVQLTPYMDKSTALGVMIDDKQTIKYFSHGASNVGFCGHFIGSLDGGNGVVLFLNSEESAIIPEVINSVATVYNWKDFYTPVIRTEITVPESILKKYPGVYFFDGALTEISKKEDGYYMWVDGISSKMHFSTEKDFFNQEFGSEKTFVTDANGNATGFLRKYNGNSLPSAARIDKADTIKANPGQLSGMAGHLLENKHFGEALNFVKRAIELDPNEIGAKVKLAHYYLFTNDYDKAITIYRQYLDKNAEPEVPVKDAMIDDFVSFNKQGLDKSLMDKVIAELKLEMPEDYKVMGR
ncbi:MAG TPA: serine hydrolase [Bacteroidia bacterium]|jgi:CubicO group peptidase (beta-lactamase class C family)|nr:serine hydrolase [Bacteroidia bacterium]